MNDLTFCCKCSVLNEIEGFKAQSRQSDITSLYTDGVMAYAYVAALRMTLFQDTLTIACMCAASSS